MAGERKEPMDTTELRTIWLVYERELVRADCIRRFEKAGVEIRAVKWDGGLVEMMRKLHRDDWVVVDHEELERMGPKFSEAFKEVLQVAHVIVISPEAVDPRELHVGWLELAKPVNCATVCAVVETVTGLRGCLEPGCCGHVGHGGH